MSVIETVSAQTVPLPPVLVAPGVTVLGYCLASSSVGRSGRGRALGVRHMGPARMELPGYEIQEVLGQGGFATVYRAQQLAVGREVALKVDSRVLATPRDRQRFLREVTAAGQLSGHPHVVPVYDAGVLADNRPYMVLELCPGGSLGDRLHQDGPLSPKEARDIGVGLATLCESAAHPAASMDDACDTIIRALNTRGGRKDDVALLILRT